MHCVPWPEADVKKIREHVQALVQSTNPLGKAMDMLQEDVESMQKELQFWTRERKSYAQTIVDQRDVLSETATKSDAALEEADEEIRAMRSKIVSVKAAILRNDDKVAKLLAMVVTPN